MQFTSVTNKTFVNYKETEPGTVIATGKVIGNSPNKYNAKNNDWQIKPLDGGPIVHLWGAGHLEWAMQSVNIGDTVQVTYLGMDTVEKKGHAFNGKPAHTFDVAIADTWEEEVETIKEVQQSLPLEEAKAPAKKKAAKKKTKASTVDLSDLD